MDVKKVKRIRDDWGRELDRYEKKEALAGFPPLPDLPAGRYVDPDFYDLEQRFLWRRTWLIAGHVDDLPEKGSYKLWRQAGAPVILVRGKDDKIRAFYNTCQHRGASLVKDESGKVSALVCQYHHWTYDLEGKLAFVPWEHEFPGLDKCKRGLVSLRCELWGNLVFVNFDQNAISLQEYLGPLVKEFEDFDLDRVKIFSKVYHDIDCNWKVLVDAFQENYHFEMVHPHTIMEYLDNRQQHFELYPNGHSLLCPKKREGGDIESHVLDRGHSSGEQRHEITQEGARTYMVFPNIIAAAAETQWFLMAYWPTGINTSRLEIYYLAPPGMNDPESEQCKQVVAAFEYVTMEDVSNLNAVQQSMETDAFKSIPLSTMERRIYQHNEEIDRVIGIENIPERLRVKPVLGAYIENN